MVEQCILQRFPDEPTFHICSTHHKAMLAVCPVGLESQLAAKDARIGELEKEIERLRIICFQAWWGFTVLRGQRPETPDWTEAQRKAMKELDRLIELTKSAGAPKKEFY